MNNAEDPTEYVEKIQLLSDAGLNKASSTYVFGSNSLEFKFYICLEYKSKQCF